MQSYAPFPAYNFLLRLMFLVEVHFSITITYIHFYFCIHVHYNNWRTYLQKSKAKIYFDKSYAPFYSDILWRSRFFFKIHSRENRRIGSLERRHTSSVSHFVLTIVYVIFNIQKKILTLDWAELKRGTISTDKSVKS